MHHISKNWEHVFDFQYKVVTGQCVILIYNYCHLIWYPYFEGVGGFTRHNGKVLEKLEIDIDQKLHMSSFFPVHNIWVKEVFFTNHMYRIDFSQMHITTVFNNNGECYNCDWDAF